jgi:hypothetical protein
MVDIARKPQLIQLTTIPDNTRNTRFVRVITNNGNHPAAAGHPCDQVSYHIEQGRDNGGTRPARGRLTLEATGPKVIVNNTLEVSTSDRMSMTRATCVRSPRHEEMVVGSLGSKMYDIGLMYQAPFPTPSRLTAF